MKSFNKTKLLGLARTAVIAGAAAGVASAGTPPVLPLPATTASTVPGNGDVNPYGVAFVPRSVPSNGLLKPESILVSNFNNNQNLQGTGSTIVQIAKDGSQTTFFAAPATTPGQFGLSAALGIFSDGLVLVGNTPSLDGTSNTARAGSLLAIDHNGKQVAALTNPSLIDGPWGLVIHELGRGVAQVFVSNVLNGNIIRLDVVENGEAIQVERVVVIVSGSTHRPDPAAFELGPSGLAYDAVHDILYFANSADNTVNAVGEAGGLTGPSAFITIYQDNVHLHGPLDLVLLPTGHLLLANSDGSNADPNQPSELVEFTTQGQFVAQYSVDPNNGGAFGVNFRISDHDTLTIAAVDDNQNILRIWTESLN